MQEFLATGGIAAVFLAIACLWMWYAIGYRAVLLYTGTPDPEDLPTYARTIKVLAAVAPLCGLLGTVAGMIETFDSLATMTLFSRGGGIGGGISQALLSTQVGLLIAVPGLFCAAWLDRRQAKLQARLEAA